MKTQESTAIINIAPHTNLKLVLNYGNVTLHLKKTDGIEMTYPLTVEGAFFNEEVSDYSSYQIIVNSLSDYDLDIT